MITTKQQPVTVGEMIITEFMEPLSLTQDGLARAMMVSRKTVNELCNNKRTLTVDTALILARVFGNTADFWLNLQKRNDIWVAMHTPKRKARIDRVQPIQGNAEETLRDSNRREKWGQVTKLRS